MRKPKPGLGDLRRLQTEATAARVRDAAKREKQAQIATQQEVERQSDARLFANAVKAVEPLKPVTRMRHAPSDARERMTETGQLALRRQHATGNDQPRPVALSDHAMIADADVEDLAYAAPGVGRDTLRRLKRAFWAVGTSLDLHGYTADEAREAIARFIDEARQCGTRCVRVVHGVGYGSAQGQPVLKSRVAAWLAQLAAVQAFATAPAAHGGRGAVLVLLRLP